MEKKLYRIKNAETLLGGVTLGVGQYFTIDSTWIRVLWVILGFTTFSLAFILYVVLWVVLPTSDGTTYSNSYSFDNPVTNSSDYMKKQSNSSNLAVGLVLIAMGVIFSFKSFFDINIFGYIKKMWPLLLVVLGVWFLVRDNLTDDSSNGPTNLPS
jgi:phage shock protein C